MKKFIKKIISSNYNFLLEDFFFKKIIKNDIIIFLYHDVSNNPSPFNEKYYLNVTPENFINQIEIISQYFKIISPLKLVDYKEVNFDKPLALISFDDGYYSYFQNVIPILEKKKIPSILFINSAPILGEIFWSGLVCYLFDVEKKIQKTTKKNFLTILPNEINEFISNKDINLLKNTILDFCGPFATECDLKKYENNEFVFYGNHLYNHYNAASISKDFFKLNFQKNLNYLKKYNNFINYFSYPFGQQNTCYNNNTDEILLKELKPKKVFYGDPLSFNKKSDYFFHRLAIDNNINNLNEFKSLIVRKKIKNLI